MEKRFSWNLAQQYRHNLSHQFTRYNEMRLMSDGGKGDKARPMQIDRDKFSSNYDNIFGAKGKKKKKKPPYQK